MWCGGCSHSKNLFPPYSGQIADRVNLRYFLTVGMLGIIVCVCVCMCVHACMRVCVRDLSSTMLCTLSQLHHYN